MSLPNLCIYHANCMDGFTAAWVVARAFSGIELYPASYGDAPPDVTGKTVLIVDFSYPHDVLVAMGQVAESVTVLDHHKSAAEALMPFEAGPIQYDTPFDAGVKVRAHFDMEKSGARLVWEYLYGRVGDAVPPIVAYTEDRDLWRWALPYSRAINAALGSYAQSLPKWDSLNLDLRTSPLQMEPTERDRYTLVAEGEAILRQRDKDIDAIVGASKREMRIGGHLVEVANVPFYLASEAGERMSAYKPFSATYYDTADGRVFSLRSMQGGEHSLDVSAIAKAYGGGGHRHAAGFKAPRGWEGDAKGSRAKVFAAIQYILEGQGEVLKLIAPIATGRSKYGDNAMAAMSIVMNGTEQLRAAMSEDMVARKEQADG